MKRHACPSQNAYYDYWHYTSTQNYKCTGQSVQMLHLNEETHSFKYSPEHKQVQEPTQLKHKINVPQVWSLGSKQLKISS